MISIDFILLIASYVLFILYSSLEGIREAYYYHTLSFSERFKGARDKRVNLHSMFLAQRATVVLIASFLNGWRHIIIFSLIFPFIHDGFYYLWRNKLNNLIYLKKFYDNPSKTSNAIMDFSLKSRTIMFIIGILFLFLIIYFR